MKTLKDFWSAFYHSHETELAGLYPGLSSGRFFREISDILNTDLDCSFHSFSQTRIKALTSDILNGKPFPYLLGEAEFYHHRFFVNENVLIPRPETELLVDMITRSGRNFRNGLDIGTGSGAIILSLVKNKTAMKGTGSDISPDALKVAKINQRRLRLSGCTGFVLSDTFQNITEKFDLIVSNPPYIRENLHRSLVHQSVVKHEPHLALFLPDDAYENWFRKFFADVLEHLLPGGEFWMEGHELELKHQARMMTETGFTDVKVHQDYSGQDRFLYGVR